MQVNAVPMRLAHVPLTFVRIAIGVTKGPLSTHLIVTPFSGVCSSVRIYLIAFTMSHIAQHLAHISCSIRIDMFRPIQLLRALLIHLHVVQSKVVVLHLGSLLQVLILTAAAVILDNLLLALISVAAFVHFGSLLSVVHDRLAQGCNLLSLHDWRRRCQP